nr:RecName: Full=Cysteine synthase; Short=CSase; AltName: Full=CP 27; AltName: Full=O-acetylserine (thiol)-lyase; Short=OAS-TL; AltName: Full=O-acetylserine sulfhydrylase [Clostridium pasteurianum]
NVTELIGNTPLVELI